MHQTHRPREAPRLAPPPQHGEERLAWFEQLEGAIAIDCLGIAVHLLVQGVTGEQVEDELRQYRSWLADRMEAAVDRYLANLSLHAYEVAA